ncbi:MULTISPECIES: hypothetical protein [Isoptericola]|uniref:Uncharacterized protein n=1 Tax=Isoptericola sediminis TaxID=2733572 RepID=A0A849JZL9_9MICO|nr:MULTISPECIES: hypothetical protein [Isoptericola]MDO8145032.1 hypothetical protein [Isoptericola sp. 178]MDO8148666.1 hypothetical protein [Isoptericola sp. b515]MDO8151388.1 hypothetical protein [Isoptericola sp. b408]NNU28736.1 hypothetical protein [Isoptericola sediminis]
MIWWAVGLWVVTLALSVGGGAWLVPLVLRHAESRAGARAQAEALAVLGNGTWIGLLERFAITGTVLAGYPEGVAVVVAVKALGRLPELREHPVAGERFVVGSLASLVWAGSLGVAGQALLSSL